MPPALIIRDARTEDAVRIAEIYNYEILNSTATLDTEPKSVEDRATWLEDHERDDYPVLVAEAGGRVVAWASLSRWSERCAYARAAEVSVYVDAAHRGQGLGRRLLEALIPRARRRGAFVLLARICTHEGEASLRLHRTLGFERIGTMRRVGEKFGRILDVEVLDLHLD